MGFIGDIRELVDRGADRLEVFLHNVEKFSTLEIAEQQGRVETAVTALRAERGRLVELEAKDALLREAVAWVRREWQNARHETERASKAITDAAKRTGRDWVTGENDVN